MDFVIGLSVLTNWIGENHNSILVIVNWLTKMVYYKSVKVTINTPGLVDVILNVVIQHYSLPDSIITNWDLLFTLKFWLSLCYILGIK